MDQFRGAMTTATDPPFRVRKVPVAPEPLLGNRSPDYADSFEVRLDQPDGHSAEEWVRVSLQEVPAILGTLVTHVHRDLLRFRLGPFSDPDHIIGWRIVRSSQDVLHMETD